MSKTMWLSLPKKKPTSSRFTLRRPKLTAAEQVESDAEEAAAETSAEEVDAETSAEEVDAETSAEEPGEEAGETTKSSKGKNK